MISRDLTPWAGGSRSLSPLTSDPFATFRREMDRLFDDFLIPGEARSFGASNGGGLRPSLDVAESDQAYTVMAELPGLEQKDVEVTLRDNALILSGEKRAERHEENGGRRYAERSFGRFERIVPFEAEVDADKVEAGFKNGVLTVTLPKNPKAQDKVRRIEVRPQ